MKFFKKKSPEKKEKMTEQTEDVVAAPEGSGYEGGAMEAEKQEQESASRVPVSSGDAEPTEERQGHLFFGRLCDMRVAVVSMNVFNIILLIIGGIVTLVKFGMIGLGAHFPGIVLSGIGIFGAMNFELWAVCLATVGYCVGLLFDLFWLNWIGILIGALIVYPHAVLCYEMKKGIMTKETYKREEYVEQEFIRV
jgi:hypothetical protein